MLTGDELREARERARMTQQQVADRVNKTLRSVGNWERGAQVPRGAESLIRAEFPEWFDQPAAPLSSVSDAQLLAEIARRFDRGRQERDGHGQQPAPTSNVTPLPSEGALDPRLPAGLAARKTGERASGEWVDEEFGRLGENSQDEGIE